MIQNMFSFRCKLPSNWNGSLRHSLPVFIQNSKIKSCPLSYVLHVEGGVAEHFHVKCVFEGWKLWEWNRLKCFFCCCCFENHCCTERLISLMTSLTPGATDIRKLKSLIFKPIKFKVWCLKCDGFVRLQIGVVFEHSSQHSPIISGVKNNLTILWIFIHS